MARGARGRAYFPTVRASWLCPPGVTDITFPMTPGWYCTSTFLTITSDFYDPNIIVEVFADGQPVTPWGITLTGPCDVSYADYYVKKVSVRIRVTNSTAFNAVLSEMCYGHMLEQTFYNEFYAPIMEYTYQMLEAIVKSQASKLLAPR